MYVNESHKKKNIQKGNHLVISNEIINYVLQMIFRRETRKKRQRKDETKRLQNNHKTEYILLVFSSIIYVCEEDSYNKYNELNSLLITIRKLSL